jgi:hypothetical protein
MGHWVIKQPDGLYAVFSTGTDQWILWDFTRDQLIEHYAQRAAEDARKSKARELDEVDAGQGAAPPFGWTFAEANAQSKFSGGEVLNGPVDEGLLVEMTAQREAETDG